MDALRSFDELIARNFLKQQLIRPVETGRLSHAQIYSGAVGTGRFSAALLVARAVNCLGSGVKPCNCCRSCVQFLNETSPNLYVVKSSGGDIKVDEIRTLIDKAEMKTERGKKCFIIRDADRLNESAQNALLKTLEEAPDYALFFLITSKPAKLLPTIRSRCMVLRFTPLPEETVVQYLVKTGVDSETAQRAAAASGGAIGCALTLINNPDSFKLKQAVKEALKAFEGKKATLPETGAALRAYKDRGAEVLETIEAEYRARLGGAGGLKTVKILNRIFKAKKELTVYLNYQSVIETLLIDIQKIQEDT